MKIMGVLSRCNDVILRARRITPQHARKHKSFFGLFTDGSPVLGHANGCETALPSAQWGCSKYIILITDPTSIKRQFVARLSFSVICLIATEMLLLSQHVVAAEWTTTPSLTLKETYSDNVALAPPSRERSDWITEINPGITSTGTGSHLKAHVSYTMQNIFYANDSSQNTTNHQLGAGANAKLVDEFLFLDGNASISQQNISLFGPLAANNTNITGNRATVSTYSISPYLRHSFGSIASSELRYTHDEVRTGVSGLSTSKGDSALFSLNSGPAFSRLGWGLHYSKQKTGYSNNPTVDYETSSGNLRLAITPRFSLTATKGYEKYSYLSISGEPPEGQFWTAGFSWTPTARTSIDASTGHRFFGKTSSLAASHRTRNTVWSLNYSQDITTTQSQFLGQATIMTNSAAHCLLLFSPAFCQQYFPLSTTNFFTNQFFLQKQLQASVVLSREKSTLALSAFDTSREAQTNITALQTSGLTLDDKTRQFGGGALWSWKFSPRTNINVSASYSKSRSISTGVMNSTKIMILGMTKQIRPKLNGSVDLRRSLQQSNQIGGGYEENAIIASLLMQF